MKLGFLYAGQGSQHPGMGADLYERFPTFRAVLDSAAARVDFDLKEVSFTDAKGVLNQTRYTQPCMVAFAAGMTALLAERGIVPAAAAGLSLGEYSALHAAGVFDADTAVELVAFRGKAMEDAAAGRPSAMVAVLGLDRAALQEACDEASAHGCVVIANYNCPGQLVLGGEKAAVETAAALAELPDYLDATLSLSFARDLSMEEFAGLAGRYPDLRFQWVGVRINDGERRQLLPLAGFDAAGLSMLGAEEDEERYPFLWLSLHREDSDLGKVYTGHFLALLGYQAERAVLVEKIGGPAGSYYRDALCYVEENGAYTYGVYVSGRPETLAALCGEAEAEWVGIESLRLSARFES